MSGAPSDPQANTGTRSLMYTFALDPVPSSSSTSAPENSQAKRKHVEDDERKLRRKKLDSERHAAKREGTVYVPKSRSKTKALVTHVFEENPHFGTLFTHTTAFFDSINRANATANLKNSLPVELSLDPTDPVSGIDTPRDNKADVQPIDTITVLAHGQHVEDFRCLSTLPQDSSPTNSTPHFPQHDHGSPEAMKTHLIDSVIGSQVDSHAETIIWANGWETVKLTAFRTESPANILGTDSHTVEWMALASQKARASGRKFVTYVNWQSRDLSRREGRQALREAISKELSHGKLIVLPDYISDKTGTDIKTVADLEEYGLLLSEEGPVECQDIIARALADPAADPNYHKATKLGTFFKGMSNPDEVAVLLDLPVAQKNLPESLLPLNESLRSWTDTKTWPSDRNLDQDNFFGTSWLLAHQAGIVTYPHLDADGPNTYIQPLGNGPKLWAVVYFKQDESRTKREDLLKLIGEICSGFETIPRNTKDNGNAPEVYSMSYENLCDIELVYACPGDFLIQPPGTLHMVYTPRASITIGGFFWSYDMLHLTEFARNLNTKHGDSTTNQEHANLNQTFVRMTLALPLYPDRMNVSLILSEGIPKFGQRRRSNILTQNPLPTAPQVTTEAHSDPKSPPSERTMPQVTTAETHSDPKSPPSEQAVSQVTSTVKPMNTEKMTWCREALLPEYPQATSSIEGLETFFSRHKVETKEADSLAKLFWHHFDKQRIPKFGLMQKSFRFFENKDTQEVDQFYQICRRRIKESSGTTTAVPAGTSDPQTQGDTTSTASNLDSLFDVLSATPGLSPLLKPSDQPVTWTVSLMFFQPLPVFLLSSNHQISQ
ncbi:hypothetical protein D9758_016744 [Tetrapyrgos nigripes]|uniref:JmjC domain-containing protein n=1 Tax=Tetrapyrgos nigripes TaxID=182062 RepID=A0A8H5FH76_9AGAR|nr:hypothetical protein D9758_016744 [Tetrapyrgos nigripes]